MQASYHDKNTAKRVTVETDQGGKTAKKLKGNHKDKTTATAAAMAEKQRIEGEQAKLSINCAYAYPAITSESPIQLQGFKAELDSLKWTVDKATHSYSKNGGLTTQLDLVATIGKQFGDKPADPKTNPTIAKTITGTTKK